MSILIKCTIGLAVGLFCGKMFAEAEVEHNPRKTVVAILLIFLTLLVLTLIH